MLDWAMFHVEHDYAPLLLRYRRALRQRNAALRQQNTSAITGFDSELALAGTNIDQKREAYLEHISGVVRRRVGELLGDSSVSLSYFRGWDPGSDLLQSLRDALPSDRARGYTQAGPHRADLEFRMADSRAQAVLSRGEGKLLVVGLLLSQVEAIRERGVEPMVLVDDLAAELDRDSRSKFLQCLADAKGQTFVTALTREQFESLPEASATVFHVEQGDVQKMV
jgi:DNA replication and repair protein RecF